MKEKKVIKIEAVKTFTPEMERLRRKGFYGADYAQSSEDEFDAKSLHVVARCENELIGMVRLTAGKPSPLEKWSNGKAPLPKAENAVDITRAAIAESWQGKDIFKLLMAEITVKAKQMRSKRISLAVEPNGRHRQILYGIGFQNVGDPLTFNHSTLGRVFLQFLIYQPQKYFPKVIEARKEILNGEKLKGFKIVSEIFDEV